MTWVSKNKYYLQNGDFTISKSFSEASILPYGLHEKSATIGFFKTADEAKAKYKEITK